MESIFACCAAVRVMSLSSPCMRRSAKPARPGPPPGDGLCAGAADAAKARIAADPNAPNVMDSFMVFPPVEWKGCNFKAYGPCPGIVVPRWCGVRALASGHGGHDISSCVLDREQQRCRKVTI